MFLEDVDIGIEVILSDCSYFGAKNMDLGGGGNIECFKGFI